MPYTHLTPPTEGDKITATDGTLHVSDHPILPFIEGDGIGPDIWRAAQHVFDSAVAKAYGGRRKIVWFEVFAGTKPTSGLANGCRKIPWMPSATTGSPSKAH